MDPQHERQLAALVDLYVRTKECILQAEELDAESKTNIAVFKKQRDALNCLMLALADVVNSNRGSGVSEGQVDSQREDQLAALVELYADTKKYILKAEELDPESKSNIAIFKEQRDALDHLMRGFDDVFSGNARPHYFEVQIEKARGHLYRAAYDSLDGMAISSKRRIHEVMNGISNDAIEAVFPDYYTRLTEMDAVEREIAKRRMQKDVGDHTLDNMSAYHQQVEKLFVFVQECRQRAGALREWHNRNWRKLVVEKLLLPIIAGAIGFLIGYVIKG